jgi:hypothetical protein
MLDACDDRRLLFLHIPKTAGTSLLVALQGVFGADAVVRVTGNDKELPGALEAAMGEGGAGRRAIVGHLPLHVVQPHLNSLRLFTVLREPVARVFSLYRFLRRAPPNNLRKWRLAPGFSFEAFLACRHPGIFHQVRNGMCRMLAGDACYSDPRAREYWAEDGDPTLAALALRQLAGIDYGLVEELPASLDLFGRRWGVPFPIEIGRHNTTTRVPAEADIAAVWKVIALNTLDLALYARATTEFRARVRDGSAPAEARAAVFRPEPNRETPVAEIAGRVGFDSVEDGGFAWLRSERPAQLVFAAPVRAGRLRLRLLRLTSDYPIGRIGVALNGRPLPASAVADADGPWFTLTTEPAEFRPELNVLSLDPPLFLSVRGVAPGTGDDRYLSVALSCFTLEA